MTAPSPTEPRPFRTRWYFGWNIVAVASVLVLLTIGLRLGIGPFFLPIVQDLGISRSLFAGIVAIGMLTYGLVMPGVGWLVARLGTRFVVLCGTVLILAGGVWTTLAHSPLTFTLAFSVVLSVGLALVSPVTVTQIISSWFVRQRGMALFFISTGGMAGLAVVTPVLTWGIALVGWRWTLACYVLLVAVIAVPGALFVLRDQPPPGVDGAAVAKARAGARGKPPATVRAALATRPFWYITIGLLANGYSMSLLGTHGVPMLVDHGFSAHTAAMGIGVIGFVGIASTLVMGRLADRLSRKHLLSAVYFVRAAAFVGLMLAATAHQLYAVAIIGGLVWSGAMALTSAMMADTYGIKLVSTLYGISYLCQQLAGMSAAWLGGWGFDSFGTHWISYSVCVTMLLIGGVTTLLLPRREIV